MTPSEQGLILCCEVHGMIPPNQKLLFHETVDKMNRYRERRRPPYSCVVCGIVWHGPGNWLQAREHERIAVELGTKHEILKGVKPISWISVA